MSLAALPQSLAPQQLPPGSRLPVVRAFHRCERATFGLDLPSTVLQLHQFHQQQRRIIDQVTHTGSIHQFRSSQLKIVTLDNTRQPGHLFDSTGTSLQYLQGARLIWQRCIYASRTMGVIRKKTAGRGSEGGVKYICDVCSVDITSTVCRIPLALPFCPAAAFMSRPLLHAFSHMA